MMIKKTKGIDLLKQNFDRVEAKFLDFFEKREPRWPSEKRDYLHNHHASLSSLFADTVSFEKLRFTDLPENLLKELHTAFEAFKNGEEYV